MSSKSIRAMILAAGKGVRLEPLTLETPKVLLPVSGVPLIRYMLSWLRNYGITEVAINTFSLADKIEGYLGDGSKFGTKITYSREETLLGTAGGVKKIESFFQDTFVVVYGDMLLDFDLSEMIRFHCDKKALITIALAEMTATWQYGIVGIREDGQITSFVEKPREGTEPSNLSNVGVYVLDKEALDYIPSQGFSDFAYDVFPRFIKLSLPIYGYRLKANDYFIDIGTIDKYHKATEDVVARKITISPLLPSGDTSNNEGN